MSEIQKADPEARRRAILLVVVAAGGGALVIGAFPQIRDSVHAWLLADPAETAFRAKLLICSAVFMVITPLVCFAAYIWLLGVRVMQAQQFPPPGLRVLHDTPVLSGAAAVTRGQFMQVIAVCLGVAAVVMCLFLWWLAWTPGGTPLIQ
jgi:hypothetical protein